ncbi:MAG: DUF427 domain-containing protein [Bacteroidales bacterium]|nr:DUF427 domain-containing protein [Bacteroidales bacterium]
MKAIWNNQIIAESDETIIIEKNHYFPPESIKKEFFETNDTHSVCPWKGEASYYTLVVNGKRNEDAAWYYPNPHDIVKDIANYVSFWKGVEIIK